MTTDREKEDKLESPKDGEGVPDGSESETEASESGAQWPDVVIAMSETGDIREFIAAAKEALISYLDERKAAIEVQKEQATRQSKIVGRAVIAKTIVLLCALGVIAWLGFSHIIAGEAVTGLLGAYVGYLWGDRKGE